MKSKKIIISILTLVCLVAAMVCTATGTENDDRNILTKEDLDKSILSDKMIEILSNKIDSGIIIYRDGMTTSPSYLDSSIDTLDLGTSKPTRIIPFPANGDDLSTYIKPNKNYYSADIFEVTKDCTMEIYTTCGVGEKEYDIELAVIKGGKTFFEDEVTVTQEGSYTTVDVEAGEQYYIRIVSLADDERYLGGYAVGK